MAGGFDSEAQSPFKLELDSIQPKIASQPSTSKDSMELSTDDLSSEWPQFTIFNVLTLSGYPFRALTKADLFRRKALFRRHNDEPFLSYHSCNTSILGTMKHPFWSQVHHLYPQMNFASTSSVFSYAGALKVCNSNSMSSSQLTLNIDDYPTSCASPLSTLSVSESFPSSDTASWSTRDAEVESIANSETDTDSDATSTAPIELVKTEIVCNERHEQRIDSASSSEYGSEHHWNRRRIKNSKNNLSTSSQIDLTAHTDLEGESGYHSESPSPPAPAIPVPQVIPPSQVVPNGYYNPNEISHMDVLSEQIYHFHTVNAQTQFTLNHKLELRDMLYYAITPIFPMCGLYVVGSSLNGFGTNNSDMDLCLMLTSKDLDQKTDAITVLKTISNALQNAPFVRNQHLIETAKVPILRLNFQAPYDDITVDLNANNSVAIRNTHLLCYYATFDWRVRPLVAVVKEWAKQRGINESTRSSFTSYSLVLMVINYLQCGADPPVLPSLQKLYPNRFGNRADIRMLNVSIPLESPPPNKWKFSNTQSLGELLLGFLEYYAMRFSYENSAICVRMGKTMNRARIMAQEQPPLQWSCIWIDEPFTRTNTAHSVYNEMIFNMIKQTFLTSFLELNQNRDFDAFVKAPPLPIYGPNSSITITNPDGNTISSEADPNKKPE